MNMLDSITLDASGLAMTRDGYLTGFAKVSRAGNVQMYLGSELGLTGDDKGKVYGVYRDPQVIFDEASMMSLAGRPVTRGHPPMGVDAKNWKDLVVGNVGGVIKRDGEHVVAPMAIMDAAAVQEVMDGARCLSAGYTVGIEAADGVSEDGTPYQFRQSGDLRFNHVAYLPDNNPRAGNTRIGDSQNASWGASPINDRKAPTMPEGIKTRTVIIDGLSVETTDAGAQALEKLTKTISDMKAETTAAEKKAKEDADEKEKIIAKKDAEIDALAKDKLTDAALDARVAARADLLDKAKRVADGVTTDGLSDADIRKAAVTKALGDAAVTGKSQAYIDARFDILVEDADKADPVRGMKDAPALKVVTNLDAVYDERNKALETAWMKKGA